MRIVVINSFVLGIKALQSDPYWGNLEFFPTMRDRLDAAVPAGAEGKALLERQGRVNPHLLWGQLPWDRSTPAAPGRLAPRVSHRLALYSQSSIRGGNDTRASL